MSGLQISIKQEFEDAMGVGCLGVPSEVKQQMYQLFIAGAIAHNTLRKRVDNEVTDEVAKEAGYSAEEVRGAFHRTMDKELIGEMAHIIMDVLK